MEILQDFDEDELLNLYLPVFHIISVGLLHEDLKYTKSHFRRLASIIDPFILTSVIHKYRSKPVELLKEFTIKEFIHPKSIQELVELADWFQLPETVSTDPVVPMQTNPFVEVPIVDIDDINENPDLISDEAINMRLNGISVPYNFHIAEESVEEMVEQSTELIPESLLDTEFCDIVTSDELCQYIVGNVVIYAPPCSGKTTFITEHLDPSVQAADTDDVREWKSFHQGVIFTNRPDVILRAKTSVAVIPTKATFEARCRHRGLIVGQSWYDDVLHYAKQATYVIYSDEFLPCIENSIIQRLRKPPASRSGVT